jgi:hypothetical protein
MVTDQNRLGTEKGFGSITIHVLIGTNRTQHIYDCTMLAF